MENCKCLKENTELLAYKRELPVFKGEQGKLQIRGVATYCFCYFSMKTYFVDTQ